MSFPARATIVERESYEPAIPQEEFIVPLLRQHIADLLKIWATPVAPHARALDVGCGRQPFRQALEALGYSYTGIDVQQNPDGTVEVVCAIDEILPPALTEKDTYQFILCTELMEHVADWDMAFRNLASLMSPGGRLLITCPHFYQLHEEPYDFWRPTLHAIKYYTERVGLRMAEQKAAGDAWDVLGTLLANCYSSSASDKLLDRGAAKLVSLCRRSIFSLLRQRRLQQRVQLHSPLYMSNIVVCERPQVGEG